MIGAKHGLGGVDPQWFERLFAHMRFADGEWFKTLADHAADARSLHLGAHLVAAEEIWLARLEGRPSRLPVFPDLSLGAMRFESQCVLDGFEEYLSRQTRDTLAGSCAYVTTTGESFVSARTDILTHVAMHGAYHRGQLAAHVRGHGGIPPLTDYMPFTRGLA